MSARKLLLPIIPIAGFLILWQVLAVERIIQPGIFSSPPEVLRQMLALWSEQVGGRSVLLTDLLVTLKRLFLASLLGILVGVAVGFFMGLSQTFYRFLDPLITIVMPIPGIAMAPLFIIWMGFGDPTIITVGAVATFFPVAYNTCTGVRSMDQRLVQAAQLMGGNRFTIFTQVYGPWAAVYVFTGIKLGLARCWRTVIAVEFIAAAGTGLGYMIWEGASYLNASIVFGGIILTALIFASIEKGMIRPLERVTIEKWGMVRN
jgi:ABC-type nitrate/sulfonate/bicarbonate transport system permease component